MQNIQVDLTNAKRFFTEKDLSEALNNAEKGRSVLLSGEGEGNDFLGWVNLPENYDKNEYERVKKAAEKIRRDSDILFVIGIGGSYLGARAATEFLNHCFFNSLPKEKRNAPMIYYVGNSISGTYLKELMDLISDHDFSVNVISKSGTTTEPAIAFRIFKELAEKKYGKSGAASRIYATTDKERGALKTMADAEGYETFTVPDDIGGRYSVLTSVGLLPIAASGIDTDALFRGAKAMRNICLEKNGFENPALLYAATRNIFLKQGKSVEILANYEPNFHSVGEWWKQLYGESEGKDNKGLFPASVDFTTDLHSMGQYIQDGQRILFETVVDIENPRATITVGTDEANLDGLNYLAGKDMNYINHCAMNGTMLAHLDGGTPTIRISMADESPESLGALFYFFEFACGVSGYMLGVNPFNQPGVESYKKNMFALLNKPGYEEAGAAIRKRLSGNDL